MRLLVQSSAIITNIDTSQTGVEYGSQTTIREGLSYQRRDDFFSNSQREDSIRKRKNEVRTATGISKDIRLSEGENLRRSDESTVRLLLLDKTVKLLDPKAKAIEFNQLDNPNIAIASKFKKAID